MSRVSPLVSESRTPTQHSHQNRSQRRKEANLNILLIGNDDQAAKVTAEIIENAFGQDCSWTHAADVSQGRSLLEGDQFDVYLVAEDAKTGDILDFVRSSIESGCHRPIIVLSENNDPDLDLRAVEAGAADCIPKDELTPNLLGRAIRHALLREHRVKQAQCEVDKLSTEISRLNTLRDANHRFVDNACHDFRSPLTVIKEFSSIIAEGLAGDINEEQAEFLEIILTRVDQLSQMVDSILDASRLESDLISVQREEHRPAALIERARPTLEGVATRAKTEINFSVDEKLPNVFADADSVGRIIVNLVTNACKFVGEGGKVDVWARHDVDKGTVTIGVTDNGPGIAPDHVKLIFERFRQVENDEKATKAGFGLGLHIASELARVNFGTLSVESEPKKGSTFAFTLPIFNVDKLVPLHFGFLKTSRHEFHNIAIALASAHQGAEPDSLSEVERFLNRQLRSYDLLLRLDGNNWLAGFACDEDDLASITSRIERAYGEHNRNRPQGALPHINFRTVGSWMISGRPEGLTDAIRSAYALGQESRNVH